MSQNTEDEIRSKPTNRVLIYLILIGAIVLFLHYTSGEEPVEPRATTETQASESREPEPETGNERTASSQDGGLLLGDGG